MELLNWKPHEHARRTDPDTSHQAAASMDPTKQMTIIYVSLVMHPDGLTAEQIAGATGLEKHAVGKRMSDLVRTQSVVDSGERRDNHNGRKATVWRAG